MKDIIIITLFVLIWNTPIHTAHPTLIPMLLTLTIIIWIIEIILKIIENQS
jgi:hypothetical protein